MKRIEMCAVPIAPAGSSGSKAQRSVSSSLHIPPPFIHESEGGLEANHVVGTVNDSIVSRTLSRHGFILRRSAFIAKERVEDGVRYGPEVS